ncbi:MAG: carboxymuconolactone decarboxylase family protein [Pseudonocardia sp.]
MTTGGDGPGRTGSGGDERYERGAARLTALADHGRAATHELLAEVCPDLPRLAIVFAYGDIASRPGLDPARRELVTIAALTALGDTARQLRTHLGSGFAAGLEPGEILEGVLQTLPYAGFPRVVNTMLVVRDVLDERGLLPSHG